MSATATPPHENTHAERITRHMGMCQELAELAMTLARAAAAKAEQHFADPPKPLPDHTQDPTLLFTRLCRVVHTAIAHEARLAASLNSTSRAAATPQASLASPRRLTTAPGLNRVIH